MCWLTCSAAAYATELVGDADKVAAKDKKALRRILRMVGIERAKVRFMERTPERQAKVMYDLAREDLERAKLMYCDAGDKVLDKYDESRSADWNVETMRKELLLHLPEARELGCLNHIKNDEVYAVDIRQDQIPEEKRSAFVAAAERAVKGGAVLRFLAPPREPDAFHFEFSR